MGLDRIHLRKLLKLFMMKESLRTTAIRADARETMRRQDEGPSPGGDFHVPFWQTPRLTLLGEVTCERQQKFRFKKIYGVRIYILGSVMVF